MNQPKTKLKKPVLIAIFIATMLAFAALFFVIFRVQAAPLDESSYGGSDFIYIDAASYNDLIAQKSSFLLFVDQNGCTTADDLRALVTEISEQKQVHFYHILFHDMRETELKSVVQYYPSVVVFHDGKVVDFLKADSDDHTALYHSKTDLLNWLNRYVKF